jgi:hypothetical protein
MASEETAAFEQARRNGYIVTHSERGAAGVQAFRQWCREQGRPFVSIENDGAQANLIFDTGSVWEHFRHQYPSLQERSFFFTLDPTDELQGQVRHIINASNFQGGAGHGGSYTWITGLPLEHAEQTVQALLNIWEQARTIHLGRLAQGTTNSKG